MRRERPARAAPRPMDLLMDAFANRAAPQTPLADLQRVWSSVTRAIPAAAGGTPTALKGSVLTVTCPEAVVAHELQWCAPDVIAALNTAVGGERVSELRVRCA